MSGPFVLLGAHLRSEDITSVRGVEAFPVADVFVSGVPYDKSRGLAEGSLIRSITEVRAALLEAATFVAIRYGVSVSSADEAAARCASFAASWKRLLERHRARFELTLKIATGTAERMRPASAASGREYMDALRALRRNDLPDPVRIAAEQPFEKLVAEKKWIAREDGAWELAMLIERGRLEECRRAAGELRAIEQFPPYLLSGPWPLEEYGTEQSNPVE